MSEGILKNFLFTPTAEDDDYFVVDTLTGAGPWTTFLQTATPDGLAHQLIVTASADITDRTFTIVGTDAEDKVISDALAIVDTTPVESVKYFKTITSITSSGTIGTDTFKLGFVDEFVSPAYPLNWASILGPKMFLDITGTLNVDVQFSIAPVAWFNGQSELPWVEPASTLAAETADSSDIVVIAPGYACWRLQMNSYSAGAVVKLYVSQSP